MFLLWYPRSDRHCYKGGWSRSAAGDIHPEGQRRRGSAARSMVCRRCGAVGSPRFPIHPCVENTAAWLACHAAFTALAALLRITWRSVVAVISRVVAERAAQSDRLTGLRRIGSKP
jgi:hypothetical protein